MPHEISLPQSYRVYDHDGAFFGHANRFFFDETNEFQISIVVDKNDQEALTDYPKDGLQRETESIPYSFLQSDDDQAMMVFRAPFTTDDIALYQEDVLQASPLVEQYMIDDYSKSKDRSGVISLL